MKKTLLSLLLCMVLLCGCGEQQPEEPVITESIVWDSVPQLNHGVLEYEKLENQPWYCGRLEYFGKSLWAETELGYYFYSSGRDLLFYADKANMNNWVPVCNRAECKHVRMAPLCNGRMSAFGFWIRDGRIYYAAVSDKGQNMPLYLGEHWTPLVASRALDGTDPRIEHVYEELVVKGGGYISGMAAPTWWLISHGELAPDGTHIGRYYLITESGMELLLEQEEDPYRGYLFGRDPWLGGMEYFDAFFGEDTFQLDLLAEARGEPDLSLYRYVDGDMERVNCDGYERTGKYLSGNTLRLYRENDGYYDLDLTTQQETFVAEAQLADAAAWVLLPNCIVEYNGEQMVVFDGESWRDVEIPEELRNLPMAVEVLASDRIFFTTGFDIYKESIALYQVVLGQENLHLEFCDEMY